jgi:hypothetical protein
MAREFNPQMGDLAQIQVYGVPEMLAIIKNRRPRTPKSDDRSNETRRRTNTPRSAKPYPRSTDLGFGKNP